MSNEVYRIKKDTLTDIADSIRTQEGSDEPIGVDEFAERILELGGGLRVEATNFTALQTVRLTTSEPKVELCAYDLDNPPKYIIIFMKPDGSIPNSACTYIYNLETEKGFYLVIEGKPYNNGGYVFDEKYFYITLEDGAMYINRGEVWDMTVLQAKKQYGVLYVYDEIFEE